jgi:hypothetical protein
MTSKSGMEATKKAEADLESEKTKNDDTLAKLKSLEATRDDSLARLKSSEEANIELLSILEESKLEVDPVELIALKSQLQLVESLISQFSTEEGIKVCGNITDSLGSIFSTFKEINKPVSINQEAVDSVDHHHQNSQKDEAGRGIDSEIKDEKEPVEVKDVERINQNLPDLPAASETVELPPRILKGIFSLRNKIKKRQNPSDRLQPVLVNLSRELDQVYDKDMKPLLNQIELLKRDLERRDVIVREGKREAEVLTKEVRGLKEGIAARDRYMEGLVRKASQASTMNLLLS